MSLIINHNLMASNVARNLNTQYGNLSNSTRRLSSGLRISASSDDAAGLAVRELMRSEVKSIHQGIRNANDAISMLQTADGALQVIDEKLIRMKELATQASSGTYNEDQRQIINQEYRQMALEVERIAESTEFNGIKLLDGSLSGVHDGSELQSTGAAKVHFGTGNDCSEDYYYINVDDTRLSSLFDDGQDVVGGISEDGILLFEDNGEVQVNEETAQDQRDPSVAMLNGGGFTVTWASEDQDGSGYGVYARTYDGEGTPLSDEFRVNTTTANNQASPTVTRVGDGNALITWVSTNQDGDGTGVYAQVVSEDGTKVGSEFLVNTETTGDQQYVSATTLNNGNALISWTSEDQDGSDSGVYGKILSPDGSTVQEEFLINNVTLNDQSRSEISPLEDGGFVATWVSGLYDGDLHGIAARRFDSTGTPVGDEFQVNETVADEQGLPTVVGLDNGGYAISWWSTHDAALEREVFLKVYDSDDNVVQSETLAHSYSDGLQNLPYLTKLDSGFALNWSSYDQDSDQWGVFGRIFSNEGGLINETFQVNDTTAGDQRPLYASNITTLENGGFVVTWQSENIDGDGTAIMFKQYSPLVDVRTQSQAQQSLDRIYEATVKKDTIRANIGATQNRLLNTITNLEIQAENLQQAESRISDVDVATEMTGFVRNQILAQSSVAMLAQANNLPKMALQLISG